MSSVVFEFQGKYGDWVFRSWCRPARLGPKVALSGNSSLVRSLQIYLYFKLSIFVSAWIYQRCHPKSEIATELLHSNLLNVMAAPIQ